jgi:lipopolysaccharide transport system ATP-binding protein
MSSEAVISARGLGKAYRIYRRPEDRLKELVLRRRYHEDFWAVREVDLSVRAGETVGLIGRNGSGKSTLLQLICGTVRPTRGALEVKGRIGALLELGAGFNPEFTGRENVWVNAAVLGLSDQAIAARFEAIAAFAGIGEYMDQPVKHYSSGMYARLAFAVCAHVDADILVVDEALSVGDGAFQQKCMRYLHAFRRRGALVFVSHDLAVVAKLCDRVLWLERGAVCASGPAREVCRRYEAALSAESTEEKEGFRIGGRGWSAPQPNRAELDAVHTEARAPPHFDPDEAPDGAGGAVIDQMVLCSSAGAPVRSLSGGEDLELRIDCRAERLLMQPTVGFVLRDRLGHALFGDDTDASGNAAPLELKPGQSFSASFRFRLPYLSTAEYALEAEIYEGTPERHRMLARLRDTTFLSVHSRHPSHGLVNVLMRAVSLTVEAEAPVRAIAGPAEVGPARRTVGQP